MTEENTISIFVGSLVLLNYCLGTGAFGIPYVFFYSGVLATLVTVVFLFVVVWLNSNYILEVMARAQAMEDLNQETQPCNSPVSVSGRETVMVETFTSSRESFSAPNFRITSKRKFELCEMSEIFFHKYVKYIALVFLIVAEFISQWASAVISAAGWASNIPFHSDFLKCGDEAFFHRVIPTGGCLYTYYICLAAFALIVVPLSLFDMKEQALIQCVLCFLRFLTIAALIVFSVVQLVRREDACDAVLHTNTSYPVNVDIVHTVVKFDAKGWVEGVAVLVYGYYVHNALSSLAYSLREKKYLHLVAVIIPATAMFTFMGLMVVALWYREAIQETVTLNWSIYTQRENSLLLQIFSRYVILYPSIDSIPGYSMGNHVIVNNLYLLITGKDTSQGSQNRCNMTFILLLRFVVGLSPVLAAMGVANLISVIKYAGIAGFTVFLLPFFLQVRSIYVCKKTFSLQHFSEDDSDGNSNSTHKGVKVDESRLYRTPYSYPVISDLVVGWVMVVAGCAIFPVLLLGLFTGPHPTSCQSHVSNGSAPWQS